MLKAHGMGFEGLIGARLRGVEDGETLQRRSHLCDDKETRGSVMFGEQVAPLDKDKF